ncbi:MAG: ABC transporter permease [Clostridia bacterium]|nr:ABC transporter permease [Clostridia bacterium]
MEVITVLWREYIFFKKRFWKITSSLIVSPLLYMIAFGWGLGEGIVVEGNDYMNYIMPGIIALTTMRSSFTAISMRISVSRLHEKSFEYYLVSPTNMHLLTLGNLLAGTLRGVYAAVIIIIISFMFGIVIKINLLFFIICFLNSLLFSALGFYAAMMIDTHYDLNRFTSFIINPMVFLCGTFFSLSKMPFTIRKLIELLPLTHSTRALRAIALNGNIEILSIFVMMIYILALYLLCVRACYREVA